MKRFITIALAAGLFVALLAGPSLAFAIVLPTPADGSKVVLKTWGAVVYEYPVGGGNWYFDGGIGNYSGDHYASGVNMISPMVTIEFFDASDVSLGTETFSAEANVVPYSLGGGAPTGYMKWVHHPLIGLPAGAVLAKTRFKSEVSPSDAEWPKYQYGIAASTVAYQGLPYVKGPYDLTLGDGRVQYDLTVTNNTSKFVGPVRVWGMEDYGMSPSSVTILDVYDVAALDPAKARRLAPGESTVFHLRGLAPTPAGENRYSDWGLEAEGEPLTDVLGTVGSSIGPVAGATASIPDYLPVTTSAAGAFKLEGVVPGTYSVTFSKAGYYSQTVPVTVSYAGDATLNPSLVLVPIPVNLSKPKVSGKATAKKGTTLVGTVAPAHATRVSIEVQVLSKKKYKRFKTYAKDSSASGAWKYKAKLKKGTYRVRVSVVASATYLAGTSDWRKVVVK